MTSGMPELGSKISLISKADIRYEGRLFTVDPQECTIALASVRSFGTEDRETQFPVPAQNQVYDYILFRGSDIKDIRVVNNVTHNQPLNDPAIMQLSVPPSLGQQPYQNHPVLGQLGGPQIPPFGGAQQGYVGMGLAPGMGVQRQGKPSELLIPGPEPPILNPTIEPPRPSNEHASVLDLIGGGSRSTTPASLGSRKSPTKDHGTQAGGSREDKRQVKPIQPPGQRNQRNKSRERRDSRGEAQHQQQQNRQGGGGNTRYYQQQQHHYQQQHYGGYQQGNHQQQQQRGGWTNRGQVRPRGRPRGGFKPNQNGGQNRGNKSKNTLKFDNDYDFEQANTEFEELRSQLSKVKIEEGANNTSTNGAKQPEMNGDVDKKDDSGNETGAGEPEQEEDHEIYYDKTKSFFDKISCEAVERAKGKSQRTDWRTERKLNSETFGVSATRRGNYRGRGGFRGGMGYRGGYRGSYRQPQRRDQNNQQQQSQQQPALPSQNQQQQGNQAEPKLVDSGESENAPQKVFNKHGVPEPEMAIDAECEEKPKVDVVEVNEVVEVEVK